MNNSQGSSLNSQAILSVSGRGLPVRGNDIDTDRIMPARFLVSVSFEGLERHVFEDDRAADPAHPFNDPRYTGASILIVNANFGCGSSREHAPQGIARAGFGAVIGESFSEIFQGNAAVIGLPCFVADREAVNQLQTLVERTPEVDDHRGHRVGRHHCRIAPARGVGTESTARRVRLRSVESDGDAAGPIRGSEGRRGAVALHSGLLAIQRILARYDTKDVPSRIS